MSTERKEQPLTERKDKDDIKQQQHQSKKLEQASSLLTTAASTVSGAMHKVLPASVADKADALASQVASTLTHNSVATTLQKDGVIAAAKEGVAVAKQTVGLGASASTASTSSTGSKDLKATVQAKAAGAKEAIQEKVADVENKVKHSKRRRGGRGHGNRKHKTKLIDAAPGESVLDSLGDKAREIKAVVVEAPKKTDSSSGLIGTIQSKATGLLGSITSAASHLMPSSASTADIKSDASSKLADLKATAGEKVKNLKASASEIKSETLKAAHLEAKPATRETKPPLERQDEIAALGTPQSPEIDPRGSDKMKANPKDQSTLGDKLSFAKDYVLGGFKDNIDNAPMNADDNSKEGLIDRTVAKAESELNSLKAKVTH